MEILKLWGRGLWRVAGQRVQSSSHARGEISRGLPYSIVFIVNNTVLYTQIFYVWI
jgi:hypothetical protein